MDPEVINRPDLFDVFVNLPDNEITVAQHAKGKTFQINLLHMTYPLFSKFQYGVIGGDWDIKKKMLALLNMIFLALYYLV